MKMVKSLILGSAATLVAMSGAQAADLPVKAKAVEYVKVCSLYGAGFWYIPGTDTCIKLGGYLRVDMGVDTNSVFTGDTSGPGAANNRFTNAYTWRSRQDLTLDTRTATEYGVVRTFFDATFTWTTDSYQGTGTGASVYGPIGPVSLANNPFTGVNVNNLFAAPNNAGSGAVANGTLGVYYAFIQFAGFTIGKAVSQFSAPWSNYPGNIYDGLVGGGGTVTGVNQFTYTAQFGNGVSGTISAQDQAAYYQAGLNNVSAGGAFGTSNYGGTRSPDIVGMVRVDQAWGLFQASAAAHQNHAAYYGFAGVAGTGGVATTAGGSNELFGGPGDRWGWAGQLALSVKNIPTGPGDTINVQGVYTSGATRYNIQDLSAAAGANTIYAGNRHSAGTYQSIGFGIAPDTVFGGNVPGQPPGTRQELIQTWGARGAYTHNWDAFWNTSIYGAFASVRYPTGAKNLVCGGGGFAGSFRTTFATPAGTAGITNCNPDYTITQAGIITRWTPVKNLTFSGEAVFQHLDQKMAGVVSAPNAQLGKPAAVYELRDQNSVQVLLRAQRNF